jgi:hypothetical protein
MGIDGSAEGNCPSVVRNLALQPHRLPERKFETYFLFGKIYGIIESGTIVRHRSQFLKSDLHEKLLFTITQNLL